MDLSKGLKPVSEAPPYVQDYVQRDRLRCPSCNGYALGWKEDHALGYPVFVCQSGHEFYPTHGLVVRVQSTRARGYERVGEDIKLHINACKADRRCHQCGGREFKERVKGYMPLECTQCHAEALFGRPER